MIYGCVKKISKLLWCNTCVKSFSYKLISIVIPVCNSEKYIEAALESIKRQSYVNLKL